MAPRVDEPNARRGYHRSSDLLAKSGSADGGHLVNRLVFSHQVRALEAYLGDTLKNEVMRDRPAMQRLIDSDADLKIQKFTLTEIAKDPQLIDRNRARTPSGNHVPQPSEGRCPLTNRS